MNYAQKSFGGKSVKTCWVAICCVYLNIGMKCQSNLTIAGSFWNIPQDSLWKWLNRVVMQKIINSTIIEINLKLLKQTIQKETHKVDQFRQTEFIIWI